MRWSSAIKADTEITKKIPLNVRRQLVYKASEEWSKIFGNKRKDQLKRTSGNCSSEILVRNKSRPDTKVMLALMALHITGNIAFLISLTSILSNFRKVESSTYDIRESTKETYKMF